MAKNVTSTLTHRISEYDGHEPSHARKTRATNDDAQLYHDSDSFGADLELDAFDDEVSEELKVLIHGVNLHECQTFHQTSMV